MLTALSVVTCFSGLAIYSKYHNCDPSLQKRITSPDMLMPLYVMDMLSDTPGVPGLFIAGDISTQLFFNYSFSLKAKSLTSSVICMNV